MPSSDRRLVAAWTALVAMTLAYLVIDRAADDDGAPVASTAASLLAIGLALVKIRIILRSFMDVHHAPKVLRITTDALVLAMATVLAATYLVGRAIA